MQTVVDRLIHQRMTRHIAFANHVLDTRNLIGAHGREQILSRAGVELMTDTSARGITATSTNHRFAIALEAATAAGQIVTVLIGGSQFSRATA